MVATLQRRKYKRSGHYVKSQIRRLAEKNIPNCAGFSFGFKARGRRIVHYVTVIATQKLDDKDKQVGILVIIGNPAGWIASD
ncbi:MAG: hypothetical protein BECKG1743D_GA0114223_102781 [Candidatus Kentron sp. G]|nr:MAG: hypothetical protein BECKG1743F_GA0114225_104982 [Candidatus Kentron sp. G]VFN01420.1 MAG: hypothetical protein BECKG1743D_GA0114223_102781 [Candidatus Kentron sp. G]VFN02252.1 MAG: hypothetical protein BECKG1743E_GA0114224_104872 [Candidatus Kentron sp. G]